MFVGTAGAVFCATTEPGALANSANAHMTCHIRMSAFNFIELPLNPQDTAKHCTVDILAKNGGSFDVNIAAIGKISIGAMRLTVLVLR
jgi:hypothetical protein